MVPQFLVVLAALSLCFPAAAERAGNAKGNAYVLAVIPSAPPVVVHRAWTPFIERLARETGLSFKLKIFNEMTEFERDLERTPRDFIFASPTQIVIAHDAQGYIPLVRSSRNITGALFVRKDSPVQTVRDLQGKEIAFVGAKNV